MTEVNSGETGTITDDVAVNMLLGEPETGANPEQDDQAAQDAEVVEAEIAEGDQPDAVETEAPAEEAEKTEPDPAEPAKFTVEIDGKKIEVTQDELTSGYMRQADYTRKTQEIAQHKAIMAKGAQALKAALAQYAAPAEAEPDWATLAGEMDPREYQQKRAQWDAKKAEAAKAKDLFERIQEQEQHSHLEAEKAQLLDRIPEWRDPVKAKTEFDGIVKVAGEFGFSPADVYGASDHRLILMARELSRLKSAETSLKANKQVTPPVVAKPAGRASSEADREKQKARDAFRKNPTNDNAVRVLLGG